MQYIIILQSESKKTGPNLVIFLNNIQERFVQNLIDAWKEYVFSFKGKK